MPGRAVGRPRRSPVGCILPALAIAWLTVFPEAANAQEHGGDGPLPASQILFGITHGVVQGAAVFLAGLAAFAALVWLPTIRAAGTNLPAGLPFGRGAWALFGVLAVVGMVDLGVYAVLGSGEPLSLGLFNEALFATGVGLVALARLGLGLLAALAVARAARGRSLARWWAAAGAGGALLVTLTPESHAATQGFLPMAAIWFHLVAAAVWMGGLIAFPMLMLGPLRLVEPEGRADLLRRTVRRFSKVATVAVSVVVLTGVHATLLNVSGPLALLEAPYGRALIMKLGLLVLLLATGGINLLDKGRGPLGRMIGAELVLSLGIFVAAGFLTSLPPAD